MWNIGNFRVRNAVSSLMLIATISGCGEGGEDSSTKEQNKIPHNAAPNVNQPSVDSGPSIGAPRDNAPIAALPPANSSTEPDQPINGPAAPGPSELPIISDTTASYIPFKGGLSVVSSLDPSKVVEVSKEDIIEERLITTYDFDPALGKATRMRPAMLLYVQEDRLFKLNLSGNSSLVPERISTAIGLNDACRTRSVNSVAVDATYFFYTLAGIDKECGNEDDRHFFALAKMNANDSPIEISDIADSLLHIEPIVDSNDPLKPIIGFLALKNKDLIRYDAQFKNPMVLISAVESISFNVGDHHGATDGVFLNVDQDIRWYDPIKNNVSPSIFQIKGEDSLITTWECDKDFCYFLVTDGIAYTLYSTSADGTGTAKVLSTQLPNISLFSTLNLTSSSILYLGRKLDEIGNDVTTLNIVPKSGGIAAELDRAENISDLNSMVNDRHIYYTKSGVTSEYIAVVRDAEGQLVSEHNKSRWIGNAYSQMSFIEGASDKIFLADTYTDKSSGLAGATVQIYNASTHTKLATAGVIPNDIESIAFFAFGETLLGEGSTKNNRNNDIFYLNTLQSDSLRRITETSDVIEEVIY